MAALKMNAEELGAIRDLLMRSASAIEHGLVTDHDDVGIIARALSKHVDHDEFREGLLGETTNPRLERWLS